MNNLVLIWSLAGLTIGSLAGWVMNIYAIFADFDTMQMGEAIVRIIGVFIPLIGAIMGWL
jgi:hypothetical protein